MSPPRIPVMAYAAPAAAARAVGLEVHDVTSDQEVIVASFATWADASRIATLSRTWRACDVYVQPAPGATTVSGTLSVFIFAQAKGLRTLVASGRVPVRSASPGAVGTVTLTAAQYAAAARCGATQFEVTGVWQQTTALGVQPGGLTIAVVGSNVETPAAEDVGAIPMQMGEGGGGGLSTSLGIQGVGTTTMDKLQLIAVQAVNGAAAARWLHLHDLATGLTAFNGLTPLFAWPMGVAIGDGVTDRSIRYRARDRLFLIPSSTMMTTTNVVDCGVQAWVR